MDSPTYIKDAIRTESVPSEINMNEAALAGILKIAELTAYLVDQAKRKIFYNSDIDAHRFAEICHKLSIGTTLLCQAAQEGSSINERLPAEHLSGLTPELVNIRLLHAAMGCFTESGELIESMDKQLNGEAIDMVNFGEEIGDIEWYQAIGFDESGVSEASCREKNIAKLRKRYPDKFDNVAAVTRDLVAERKELE